MNKTYNVQNILNEMKKYENNEITIKTKNKEFDVKLFENFTPHLLGLQYMKENHRSYRGIKIINDILDNEMSDEDIIGKVRKNNPDKLINVENRINTFLNFMKNIEKGILVEKTLETGMSVNYLIIQNKEDKIMHLGIMSCDNGALLNSYEELSKSEKDFFKTYFLEQNDRYFQKSKIFEKIENIQIYDKKNKDFIPFSFDEDKNQFLIEKYKDNKNLDYQQTIKEYESIGKLDKDQDLEEDYGMEM